MILPIICIVLAIGGFLGLLIYLKGAVQVKDEAKGDVIDFQVRRRLKVGDES